MSFFYFIRHAPTQNNIDKVRCGGDVNVPLINGFEDYTKPSLIELNKFSISNIYTSDLIRTYETAKFIAKYSSTAPAIVIDNRLKERFLGKLNFQEITSTENFLKNPPKNYGVENNDVFASRILDVINHIKNQEKKDISKTLVVSSKGVARVLSEQFKFEIIGPSKDIYANCQLIKFFLN